MARQGRKTAAYHARHGIASYSQFASVYADLAQGLEALLNEGDYEAFEKALEAVESAERQQPEPLDAKAPRGQRLAEQARRLAAATFAANAMTRLTRQSEERAAEAQAMLVAIASETAELDAYWRTFIDRVKAAGIRQADVHPITRGLAEHVAAAIRDFKGSASSSVDETYSDVPLTSWKELPREFAGFKLVDADPDEPGLAMLGVFPLPPSTDISYFTPDRSTPAPATDRNTTYRQLAAVIKAWEAQNQRQSDDQQPYFWAMLLAHRLKRDESKVSFFNGRFVESPWEKGGVVRIDVVDN